MGVRRLCLFGFVRLIRLGREFILVECLHAHFCLSFCILNYWLLAYIEILQLIVGVVLWALSSVIVSLNCLEFHFHEPFFNIFESLFVFKVSLGWLLKSLIGELVLLHALLSDHRRLFSVLNWRILVDQWGLLVSKLSIRLLITIRLLAKLRLLPVLGRVLKRRLLSRRPSCILWRPLIIIRIRSLQLRVTALVSVHVLLLELISRWLSISWQLWVLLITWSPHLDFLLRVLPLCRWHLEPLYLLLGHHFLLLL